MANKPLPGSDVPLVMPNGAMNPVWYQFFVDLLRRLAAQEAGS